MEIDEAAKAWNQIEKIRCEYFGAHPLPWPPPSFAEDWHACLHGHKGDIEWLFDTYRTFLANPWAQSLRPKGSLAVFLRPAQWPAFMRPKEAKASPCARCGAPHETKVWDEELCYPCLHDMKDSGEYKRICLSRQTPLPEIATHRLAKDYERLVAKMEQMQSGECTQAEYNSLFNQLNNNKK